MWTQIHLKISRTDKSWIKYSFGIKWSQSVCLCHHETVRQEIHKYSPRLPWPLTGNTSSMHRSILCTNNPAPTSFSHRRDQLSPSTALPLFNRQVNTTEIHIALPALSRSHSYSQRHGHPIWKVFQKLWITLQQFWYKANGSKAITRWNVAHTKGLVLLVALSKKVLTNK